MTGGYLDRGLSRAPGTRWIAAGARGLLAGVAAAAALTLASCPPTPPPAPLPASALQFGGCAEVLDGPLCRLDDGAALTIWLDGEPAVLREDGAAVAADPVPADGGWRWRWVPSPAATSVTVERDGPDGTQRTRLALAPAEPSPVETLELPEDRDAARARFWDEWQALPRDQVGPALAVWARLEMNAGQRRLAIVILRNANDAHAERGARSRQVRDGCLLAHLLTDEGRVHDADEVLAGLPVDGDDEAAAAHLDSAYFVRFARGRLARHVGDHRAALGELAHAERLATRLGHAGWLRMARAEHAEVLALAGRHADALARIDEALADPALDDCDRAALRTDRGWYRMEQLDAGGVGDGAGGEDGEDGGDPVVWTRDALADSERACPADGIEARLANLRINLARALLQRDRPGDTADAADALADALDAGAPLREVERMWALELQGQIALDRGAIDEATAHYRELADAADATLDPEFAWRAAYGAARVAQAAGRTDEALAAHRRADELLLEHSLLVPVQLGRDAFFVQRAQAARDHVALLLASGRDEQALAQVRTLRVRALAGLLHPRRLDGLDEAQRDAWLTGLQDYTAIRAELAAQRARAWSVPTAADDAYRAELRRLADGAFAALDQASSTLPAGGLGGDRDPAPGELMLAWFALDDGWVRFALDAEALLVDRLGPVDGGALDRGDADALAEPLLDGLDGALARAARVTLLPPPALDHVALHAMPWRADGGAAPLGLARPTAYALDLPAAAGPPVIPRVERAAVVADPRGDLPGARDDGRWVRDQLGARGVALESTGAADADAVRAALGRIDLLHYAGHAEPGDAPLAGRLLLNDDSELTVGDLLAAPAVPPLVVLLGCRTAGRGADSGGRLGLAEALVTAGSAAVIATPAPVDDHVAGRYSQAFHGALAAHGDPREAQRAAAQTLYDADLGEWSQFRLITP